MFSICATARGWLFILLSLLVVFPTCQGGKNTSVSSKSWLDGGTELLSWTREVPKAVHLQAPPPFLAPLGVHHEEAQRPMSNFLRCSERQEQGREEKVLPSSWPSSLPSSLTTEKFQTLLSLACKMAGNHLATSGTRARYQLDIAQIHQAIYHCHSYQEKELYPACVGCTFKPSLC